VSEEKMCFDGIERTKLKERESEEKAEAYPGCG